MKILVILLLSTIFYLVSCSTIDSNTIPDSSSTNLSDQSETNLDENEAQQGEVQLPSYLPSKPIIYTYEVVEHTNVNHKETMITTSEVVVKFKYFEDGLIQAIHTDTNTGHISNIVYYETPLGIYMIGIGQAFSEENILKEAQKRIMEDMKQGILNNWLVLKYPVKEDQSWEAGWYSMRIDSIESLPEGTTHTNAVHVTESEGEIERFFVPNIGEVKRIFRGANFETITTLKKIEEFEN